jgi:hypothetical protein
MHYTKLSKSKYLSKVGVLFSNSLSDEAIRKALFSFGYNDHRLSEGKKLFDELSSCDAEHVLRNAEKIDLFYRKKNAQEVIHHAYMKFLKIARIAFDEDMNAAEALLLDGPRERTYKKWYFQVSVFCNNLLNTPDFLASMETFGVKKTQIEQLRMDLDNLSSLSDKCVKITGVVRMLVQKKKKQTIRLQDWVSDYIKIARIALEDSPQNLAKIGITVKS